MKKYNVAVVGATGLVGQTFLKVLEEYAFPIQELKLFASEKSVGKEIQYCGKVYKIQKLERGSFIGIDFALFSAGGAISLEWAPIAEAEGALVIDNSSTWRMQEDCSLIVPEINPLDYKNKRRIIANPNCSTIQSVIPLFPLDKKYGIKRVIYTTFQAVSGSGQKGINDYERCLSGETPNFYPYNISETCIPQIDVFLEDGYTKEEMKMVNETRKILHHPDLLVNATCVRVPVKVAHGVSIVVELEKDFTLEDVRETFASQEGLVVVDDPKNSIYPVSTLAAGNNNVYVGRIRRDYSCPNSLAFYCVADNVRKGAAANAVQIAKKIIEEV